MEKFILKPCPFCGTVPHYEDEESIGSVVTCHKCKTDGPWEDSQESNVSVVRWNTRFDFGTHTNVGSKTEKMLTFEEWDNETFVRNIAKFDESERRKCFEAARLGTIPAENAVVIPAVGEWPEGAEAIYVGFYDKTVLVKKIAHIPRPRPVWVPKVGEAVFYLHDLDAVGVDVISRIDTSEDKTSYWMTSNVSHGWFSVKPFHESHIGKPWSEIPGEPS